MVVFTRNTNNAFLYEAASEAGDAGWTGYLLPAGTDPAKVPDSFNLADSFAKYPGSYLFSYTAPALGSTALAQAFVDAAHAALGMSGPSLVWLPALSNIAAGSTYAVAFNATAGMLAGQLTAPITADLTFNVINASSISPDGDGFVLQASENGGGIVLSARNEQQNWKIAPNQAYLSMRGASRGTFQFTLRLDPTEDFDTLVCALRYCYADGDGTGIRSQYYPFLDTGRFDPTRLVEMVARLDPTCVTDTVRTFLCFTGRTLPITGAAQPTRLFSTFVTDARHPIELAPVGWDGTSPADPPADAARLVFTHVDAAGAQSNACYMAPHGDFRLGVDHAFSAATAPPALLAGFAGTETIGFTPYRDIGGGDGDRLSFVAYRPAWAPVYPLPPVSPTGRPPEPGSALRDLYLTSWVNVRQGKGSSSAVAYHAQPQGAALYNNATMLYEHTRSYLGYFETPAAINQADGFCFPLAPYASVQASSAPDGFSFDDIAGFETAILNPLRKRTIQDSKQALPVAHTLARRGLDGAAARLAAGAGMPAATPQGLLATVDTTDSTWSRLTLARNDCARGNYTLQFEQLPAPLRDAFQSNQLMLVASDGRNFGARAFDATGTPLDPPQADPVFHNLMAIEDWLFAIDTPSDGTVYGDYTNVVLFKFCEGALGDLIQNPKRWTDPLQFNDAALGMAGLTGVSSWIADYFAKARNDRDRYPGYFGKFCDIIDSPTWRGILVLKADVAHLPSSIQGLMAGVVYPDDFFVHHFGIEINPVRTDENGVVALDGNSSLFGLISYLDRDYQQQLAAGQDADQPVPPRPGGTYDFKVLSFQSLFSNSAVAKFDSKTQLTCNQLFGEVPTSLNGGTDNYNSMIIEGSYQNQNGKPVYVFATRGNNAYGFSSSIFNALNVGEGRFHTVSDGGDGGDVVSVFSLSGKLDYRKLEGLDMFSFGSDGVPVAADPKGLAYANLFIRMTSSRAGAAITDMAFDTSSMTFDVPASDARQDSLYPNFALDLRGLIGGDARTSPASMGYLRLQSDARLNGSVGPWYGLECTLNLGTPGALASAAGFVSSLALCWSPSAVSGPDGSRSYKAYLGLRLPGAGANARLLSLQGVLKLSVGEMKLSYLDGQQAYMLVLYDIALKFLGLVKIPPTNGRTSFYLFGGPKGAASQVSELGWYAVYNVEPQGGDQHVT